MKTALTTEILNLMTHAELAELATQIKVPVGKIRSRTVSNLKRAINKGKAQIKTMIVVSIPKDGVARHIIKMKTFRSSDDPIIIPLAQEMLVE